MSRGASIALWLLLAVSLFGNAVTIGFVIKARATAESLVGPGLRDLPGDMRADLRGQLGAHRAELRAGLARLAKARRAVLAASTATPYDATALDQAMADVRQATTELQIMTQDLLKATLAARAASGN